MHGRANLKRKRSFQSLFTDLRPFESFAPAPDIRSCSRSRPDSLVLTSICHLSNHISKEWAGKLNSFEHGKLLGNKKVSAREKTKQPIADSVPMCFCSTNWN